LLADRIVENANDSLRDDVIPCRTRPLWSRHNEAAVDQRELVELARRGDPDAFARLVDPALARLDAAARLTPPIFFIQAANDYSVRPTIELAAALEGTGKVVQSKVYPAFGLTRDEGHQLYMQGPALWGEDVRRFLERWL